MYNSLFELQSCKHASDANATHSADLTFTPTRCPQHSQDRSLLLRTPSLRTKWISAAFHVAIVCFRNIVMCTLLFCIKVSRDIKLFRRDFLSVGAGRGSFEPKRAGDACGPLLRRSKRERSREKGFMIATCCSGKVVYYIVFGRLYCVRITQKVDNIHTINR